ncbi:hypothetical protein JNB63_05410 [Microbacterium trichothecenolyticum]|uniref:hypothetical protein n=1 Tax=Microbacterium trichothecenolyticum TaxID=69370 RepID=UPI001C6EC97E|nr:hypothetical protein [Microbacterium trichothecenolyticum]
MSHDGRLAKSFDSFLVFGSDGRVFESSEPVWDESRVTRTRSRFRVVRTPPGRVDA